MDWKRVLGLALCAGAIALVLWGLFFVKAGPLTVKIDLPPAISKPVQAKAVMVTIDGAGAISIDGRRSSLDTLDRDLAAWAPYNDRTVLLQAAENLPYKTLMAVARKLEATGRYKTGVISGSGPNE